MKRKQSEKKGHVEKRRRLISVLSAALGIKGRRSADLPAGQLSLLCCGTAVIASESVLGFLEEGVQAVLEKGRAASKSGLSTQVLQAAWQQSLLHVGVPAAVHLLWDLWGTAASVGPLICFCLVSRTRFQRFHAGEMPEFQVLFFLSGNYN